ncbi:LysE family transporter [Streptomyces galilaeus]
MARASVAGNATGLVLWYTAAAAGLSAVLPADPAACTVVRVTGGLVLIVLGISTLRSTHGANDAASECPDARRTGWWNAYAVGRGQAFVSKPLVRRWVNIVTGAVLPALGVAVAGGV